MFNLKQPLVYKCYPILTGPFVQSDRSTCTTNIGDLGINQTHSRNKKTKCA